MNSLLKNTMQHLADVGAYKRDDFQESIYEMTPLLSLVIGLPDTSGDCSCYFMHLTYHGKIQAPSYNYGAYGTLYNYIKSLLIFPDKRYFTSFPDIVIQSLREWCAVYPTYSYKQFKLAVEHRQEMSYTISISNDVSNIITCSLHTYKKDISYDYIELSLCSQTESEVMRISREELLASYDISDFLMLNNFEGVQVYCRKKIIDEILEDKAYV